MSIADGWHSEVTPHREAREREFTPEIIRGGCNAAFTQMTSEIIRPSRRFFGRL
jgi:hypothetical protein